ncbi:MAG: hypothetical protein JNK50_11920 [Bacteroidia bacterium]|nr:hypothetical protein [Bacteroidia bacterium]
MNKIIFLSLSILLLSCSDSTPEMSSADKLLRDSLFLVIHQKYESMDFKNAESVIDEMKPFDEKDFEYFKTKAQIKYNLEKAVEALLLINRALKVHPLNSQALYIKAAIFSKLRFEDSALIYLNKAIMLDPGNEGYFYARAQANAERGLFLLALDDLDRCIKLRPDKKYELISYRTKIRLSISDTIGTIADCDTLIALQPTKSFAYGQKAYCLLWQSNYGEALKILNHALNLNAGDSQLYLLRFSARQNLEDKKCCEDLEQAILLGNQDAYKYIKKCEEFFKKKGVEYRFRIDTLQPTKKPNDDNHSTRV